MFNFAAFTFVRIQLETARICPLERCDVNNDDETKDEHTNEPCKSIIYNVGIMF